MGNAEMVWAFREKYEQCIIERNTILSYLFIDFTALDLESSKKDKSFLLM